MSATMTSEQLSQFVALAQTAVCNAIQTQVSHVAISYEEAQQLIENVAIFQNHYKNATFSAFRELYLKPLRPVQEYSGPESLADQLQKIRYLFPHIGGANVDYVAKIKSGERTFDTHGFAPKDRGFWCIPRWQTIAPTYSEAVRKVLGLLKEYLGGKFSVSPSSQIDEYCLKESQYKRKMMDHLFAQQDADVIIIEAQCGNRYAGMVAKEVRARMAVNEFCLGVFEVAMMLLLSKNRFHPETNNLGIDASGDLWRYPGSEKFVCTPFFSQRAMLGVEFGCHRMLDKKYYGAASGLVPLA